MTADYTHLLNKPVCALVDYKGHKATYEGILRAFSLPEDHGTKGGIVQIASDKHVPLFTGPVHAIAEMCEGDEEATR